MSSSLKSAHCKERQLERGISDSDIDRAIEHARHRPALPPSVISVMTGRRTAVLIMNPNEYNNKTVVVEKLKT